jgi:hypothetical protein
MYSGNSHMFSPAAIPTEIQIILVGGCGVVVEIPSITPQALSVSNDGTLPGCGEP